MGKFVWYDTKKGSAGRYFVKILSFVLAISMLVTPFCVKAAPQITAPSAVLMEASTGRTLFEKNSHEHRHFASITKIMTLILAFEAINDGKLSLDDEVVVSQHAASMGGSQVYLEEGEVQTLDTMLKCIAVSSGNDASVAVAEKVSGSEEIFVERMNEKAQKLGMKDTHFVDCCGLTDAETHYSSAYDVAIMSNYLISTFPEVLDYTKIWMEDIIHHTRRGDKVFTLSSTNKLLKQSEYITGLKTGSTSLAKYCMSATATKNGITLISVILGAEDKNKRFKEAKLLLEYGFDICKMYEDPEPEVLPQPKIKHGKVKRAKLEYEKPFRYLDTERIDFSKITRAMSMSDEYKAPIHKGDEAGHVAYLYENRVLGKVSILFQEDYPRADYLDCFISVICEFLL